LDYSSRLKGIYLISEPHIPKDWDAYEELLLQFLQQGLSLFQLRIKIDDTTTSLHDFHSHRLSFAKRLRLLTQRFGCLFVINDDLELACHVEADGLHLGPSDLSFHEARSRALSSMFIGLSHHRAEEVFRQHLWPADYMSLGPLYGTTSKTHPDPVMGYPLFEKCLPYFTQPVCAIGGVTLERLPRVLQTGVEMVGVISDIWRNPDPVKRWQEWQTVWKSTRGKI
jgi:thiamine-phosphate pyrophosphorylase